MPNYIGYTGVISIYKRQKRLDILSQPLFVGLGNLDPLASGEARPLYVSVHRLYKELLRSTSAIAPDGTSSNQDESNHSHTCMLKKMDSLYVYFFHASSQ